MTSRRSFLFAVAVAGVLAGCGGGGDGGSAPPPPPAPPPSAGLSPTCTGPEAFSAVADTTVVAGKVAGAVVAGCTGALSDVQWTQTGGPAVTLLAAKSQAISFEPAVAGTYSFRVDFRDAGGIAQTASVNTVVTGTAATGTVVARVDQAVRKGGKASLRVWPAAASDDTITWTQTAGPLATIDTNNTDQERLLFTAPDVARDTALVFRVTRRTAAGATDTDDVMVLVENYAQAPANNFAYAFSGSHVSRVHPYRASGPYAGVLTRCVYDPSIVYFGSGTNACTLATLPFLHQATAGGVPAVAQIMDRVLVSHDWMGQVFEQFLTTQANDDIKRLFNGVTAIVIGAHVRPSFYYAATGAIYLDADGFWLSAEQRDVIDETPDYRSEFDRDLAYSSAWRYTTVEGGVTRSIFVNFPPTSRISRDLSYLLAESGWLLYHELGHASDFLPTAARANLNNAGTAWSNIAPWFGDGRDCNDGLPSDTLCATYPLQSQELFGLAQVKFQGATATTEQRAYTATQVGAWFAADRANDEYNYSTTREDATMLFEEVMMYRNHGWRRDVAFTDKVDDNTTGSNLTVRWGQRGRIGEATVKPRAQLIVGLLAPWVLAADPNVVTNLPPPLAMRPGESWTANLTLPAPPQGSASIQALRTPGSFATERAALMRDIGRHHGGSLNDRLLTLNRGAR
jgi:hypothetical protein